MTPQYSLDNVLPWVVFTIICGCVLSIDIYRRVNWNRVSGVVCKEKYGGEASGRSGLVYNIDIKYEINNTFYTTTCKVRGSNAQLAVGERLDIFVNPKDKLDIKLGVNPAFIIMCSIFLLIGLAEIIHNSPI